MKVKKQKETLSLPLEESGNQEVIKKPITNVKKILKFLYSIQRPVRYSEICEDTGITYNIVKATMIYLNNFKAITKIYETSRDKITQLPKRIVWISLNEKQMKNARRVLRKSGI